MGHELWAGKVLLKRIFREFFIRILEDTKETRSFLSFNKQSRDSEPISPQIILFQGENGLGKTGTVAQCISIVKEAGEEFKKSTGSVCIDFEDIFLNKSNTPSSVKEFTESIFIQIQKNSSVSHYFVKYREFTEKLVKIQAQVDIFMREDWPLEQKSVQTENADKEINQEQLYKNWLQKKLTRQEYDYFINQEKHRTDFFVKGFIEVSADIPTLIIFDSYECVPVTLEQWLRQEFLARVYEQRQRLITIISGYGHFSRYFRNEFPEDLIFTFDFSDNTMTKKDIGTIASQLHCQVNDIDIELIEQYSAGIPMAVIDIIRYIEKGYSSSVLTSEIHHDPWNAHEIMQGIFDSFLSYCKVEKTKLRLISLALIDQYNTSILAALWDCNEVDVSPAIEEMQKGTVFFSNGKLHSTIRNLIREYLLKDLSSEVQVYRKLFDSHKEICELLTKDILLSDGKKITDTNIKYNDSNYTDALLNLVGASMWCSPDDALRHLSIHYLELLYFNPNLITRIVWRISEFQSFLTNEQEAMLSTLHNGLSFISPALISDCTPLDSDEVKIIEYIDKYVSEMNPFQQSLVCRKKGELEFRSGDPDAAMKYFRQGIDLCKLSDSDCTLFYDCVMLCGQAFKSSDNHVSAIDSFSIASSVRPDSFISKYLDGLSNIALNQYDSAVNVLSAAVKINPDYQDAWYNLGVGLSAQEHFDTAVDAFNKAIDKGPKNQFILFGLGSSLHKLQRHAESVDALSKVVEINPGHADAWNLIGVSSSVLNKGDEAIEAFRKAVAIKPEMINAHIALANELYTKKLYNESADAYGKALTLNNKDCKTWSNLAKVYYDSEKYEQAVDAGQKSVDLETHHLEPWMTLGNAYFALEKYPEAINAFVNASEIAPENPSIWNLIGKSHYALVDYNKAIEAFQKAVHLKPSIEGTWYDLGLAYSVQENFKDAADAFVKAGDNEPEKPYIWLQLGDMYMALHKFSDAITSYSKTVLLEPNSYDALYRKGLACMQTGNVDDAIISFVKAAELNNSDFDTWYQMGVAYYTGGHLQESIQAFTMATTIDPLRPDIWKQLGSVKMDSANYSEAIDAFAKSLELLPDDSSTWIKTGICYNLQHKYTEAISTLQKAISLGLDDIEIYKQSGLACHNAGELDSALEFYKIITEKEPDSAEAWSNMALALHYKGDYDSAAEIYQKVINITPENPYTWYNLGLAYHSKNDFFEAIKAYRQAVKFNPDIVEIWFHLGMAFNAVEQYGESIQAYRKVVQLDNDNLDAWFNLGLSYFIWGQYDDALESYEKVTEIQPDHFEALANLGATFYALSNYDKTIDFCTKALSLRQEPSTRAYLLLAYINKQKMDAANEEAEALLGVELSREEIIDTMTIMKNFIAKNSTVDLINTLYVKLEKIIALG